jgi:predicted transposase YbfD/YdcC
MSLSVPQLSFLEHFSKLPDFRISGMVTYPLNEVLMSTLVGVICGAEDWEEIVLFSREHLGWLRKFLPYESGIASAQTFRLVFSGLDSECFSQCFSSWVGSLVGHIKGVVAIDGKTLCGSKWDSSGGGALHVVSAFAHEAGLVIGQRAVDAKSNEITAIPELLDSLALEGAIVTIDAIGTQKNIAARIIEKKADYVLALKGNQGTLHKDVRLFFEEGSKDSTWYQHDTTDGDHGRIEQRFCTATDDIDWLKEQHNWQGLRSIIRIKAFRTDKKTGVLEEETRYYISSLPPDAANLMACVRAHWSIENNLHWHLDVSFREDACRTRKDHAALNLAIIRHIAINMLKKTSAKLSIRKKQCKAAWNQTFRENIFTC